MKRKLKKILKASMKNNARRCLGGGKSRTKRSCSFVLLILAAIGFCVLQYLQEQTPSLFANDILSGRVVRVFDGDTIEVLDDTLTTHRVRFQAIDAPEKDQDFGSASRKHLHTLVYGKTVRVLVDKRDKYERVVGRIWLGDVDIEEEMLAAGLAWHYTNFNEEKKLAAAQKMAQEKKIGLWSRKDRIPPWEFRQRARSQREKSTTSFFPDKRQLQTTFVARETTVAV
ncbi:MAG: thermonuclease family protein [Planctomycetia bacterium]|nr:thermonuclease family protein [Planctomycetia bacterium]